MIYDEIFQYVVLKQDVIVINCSSPSCLEIWKSVFVGYTKCWSYLGNEICSNAAR